jgi:ABC-type phosphate transport system auxiliary subunit
VDEDVAAALRALQRRIQQLEEKVDTLHAHEQD